jgi:hypothetical protein
MANWSINATRKADEFSLRFAFTVSSKDNKDITRQADWVVKHAPTLVISATDEQKIVESFNQNYAGWATMMLATHASQVNHSDYIHALNTNTLVGTFNDKIVLENFVKDTNKAYKGFNKSVDDFKNIIGTSSVSPIPEQVKFKP